MLGFCVLGAGRIGAIHAENVAALPGAELRYVVDTDPESGQRLAQKLNARFSTTPEPVWTDPTVGAVVIATPTNTHVDLIQKAARAGRAIFCEKPIDLEMERVDRALGEVRQLGVPFFVAFNRRFDPTFRALHEQLVGGTIGRVEIVTITSRDPAPPPVDYVRVSGGLFRDMMIHDFDMARWLLGSEPVEVVARASCLVDSAIGDVDDVDTAAVILTTAEGTLAQISNSRRAVYGYDQRIEVHGEKGMLRAENQVPTAVSQWLGSGVRTDQPLHFFLERYEAAYRAEMAFFVDGVNAGGADLRGAEDGRRALTLADAATESARTGRVVRLTDG